MIIIIRQMSSDPGPALAIIPKLKKKIERMTNLRDGFLRDSVSVDRTTYTEVVLAAKWVYVNGCCRIQAVLQNAGCYLSRPLSSLHHRPGSGQKLPATSTTFICNLRTSGRRHWRANLNCFRLGITGMRIWLPPLVRQGRGKRRKAGKVASISAKYAPASGTAKVRI